jgi:hypothetical protein
LLGFFLGTDHIKNHMNTESLYLDAVLVVAQRGVDGQRRENDVLTLREHLGQVKGKRRPADGVDGATSLIAWPCFLVHGALACHADADVMGP